MLTGRFVLITSEVGQGAAGCWWRFELEPELVGFEGEALDLRDGQVEIFSEVAIVTTQPGVVATQQLECGDRAGLDLAG